MSDENELIRELYSALKAVTHFADKSANGLVWRFRDQPCAKQAEEVLAKVRARHATGGIE